MHNVRGTGRKVVMVMFDEFLFFDPRALPVILPTLANGAALVMTSSIAPNAADDLMRLFDARYPDGTRVVKVINWIEACPTCSAQNRADRCTHVTRRPQHFQNGTDVERLKALLKTFPGAYEREMQNQVDEPTRRPAFDKKLIDNLVDPKKLYKRDYIFQRVYIIIDPNGGSLSSDFVLTSIGVIRINNKLQLVVLLFFRDGGMGGNPENDNNATT